MSNLALAASGVLIIVGISAVVLALHGLYRMGWRDGADRVADDIRAWREQQLGTQLCLDDALTVVRVADEAICIARHHARNVQVEATGESRMPVGQPQATSPVGGRHYR